MFNRNLLIMISFSIEFYLINFYFIYGKFLLQQAIYLSIFLPLSHSLCLSPTLGLITIYKYDSASNKLSPHKITEQRRIITHNSQRLKKKVSRFVVGRGIISIIVDGNHTQIHYKSVVVDPSLPLSLSRSSYYYYKFAWFRALPKVSSINLA